MVNMPGMDDEPSTTFTNLPVLFSKLGISDSTVDGAGGEVTWRVDKEQVKEVLNTPPKPPPTTQTWREAIPKVW